MARPSELQRVAMRPTPWVRFWRNFFPFQVWRFAVLNFRMLAVIWISHHEGGGAGGGMLPEEARALPEPA